MADLKEDQYAAIREQMRAERDAAWAATTATQRATAAAGLLRKRAGQAATGCTAGAWTLEWESCDCQDGLCGHGSFTTGVRFAQSVVERRPGAQVYDSDRDASSEIPTDAMVWMLTLQPATGLLIAAAIEANPTSPEITALADSILLSPSTERHAHASNAEEAGLVPDQQERWWRLTEAARSAAVSAPGEGGPA